MSIPFTQKQPQEAEIQVVGGDRPGLEVKENELIIIPFEFSDFNTLIRFTLGGQTTNARITIGQIVNVRIGKDAGGFNWDDGVLHHSYFFNAELPNSVDLGGSTQKWLVNGQEAGKE